MRHRGGGGRLRARAVRFLGFLGFQLEGPDPLPRLIRAALHQNRVLQVGDSGFDAFDKAFVGPSVDIFYQNEDLYDVGWAPQIPFVGVAPIPMQTWIWRGSNKLSYRGG